MRKPFAALLALMLSLAMALAFSGCTGGTTDNGTDNGSNTGVSQPSGSGSTGLGGSGSSGLGGSGSGGQGGSSGGTVSQNATSQDQLDEDGWYYDVESVVLYLDRFGHLPDNYITKKEAKSLGWEGGSVERYREGAAIGGDRFGNYEGTLPSGPSYTECDIDTHGYSSRGSRRLIFSNTGKYYYTSDHYESFTELTVEDGEVVWL